MNLKYIVPILFALALVSGVSAATTVVTPDDMAANLTDVVADPTSWFFYNDETDTIDNSLGAFVMGPGTPPAGDGSVEIVVSGTERRNLATYQFAGTPLADITDLRFSTYNPSLGNGGSADRSAYLNFNVDFDGSDTWQRRLAYVPRQNGAVLQDAWQEWDAIDGGGALWWWSGYASSGNMWPDGNTDEYRTWDDLLTSFPGIRVRVSDPWLGLRVGEPYADGYTENMDAFVFGVTGEEATTFDFEADEDSDGVGDGADLCPATEADAAADGGAKLKPNRWIWNGTDWIVGQNNGKGGGPDKDFTIEETLGCGCDQILAILEEKTGEDFNGHHKFGCSQSVLEEWIDGWYPLDTILVSPHNDAAAYPDPEYTNVGLFGAEDYRFTASGVWSRVNEFLFDAQYSDKGAGWGENGDPLNGDLVPFVDDGAAVVAGDHVDWGPLDEVTHTYEYFASPGADGPVGFLIWMNDATKYPENVGPPLEVDIAVKLHD